MSSLNKPFKATTGTLFPSLRKKRNTMFYPVPDLEEIMPDVMAEQFEKKAAPHHKNRMGYFTRASQPAKNIAENEKRSRQPEPKEVEQGDEGTKGNIPEEVIDHKQVAYSFKGATVMLTGLDDSFTRGMNNGTWGP